MSREMAHKVIVPQKKIMSQSFLNSGTLVIFCVYQADRIVVTMCGHWHLILFTIEPACPPPPPTRAGICSRVKG
jgi:hypothetical protein